MRTASSRRQRRYLDHHETEDSTARRVLQGLGQKPDRDPARVRRQLGLKPGDTLRTRVTDAGVLLDKAPAIEADNPFATFS